MRHYPRISLCLPWTHDRRDKNLWGGNVTADASLSADFARCNRDAEISSNVDSHLHLAALLEAADGGFGEGLAGLPDLLTLVLLLLLAEVAVVLILLVLGGLGSGLVTLM